MISFRLLPQLSCALILGMAGLWSGQLNAAPLMLHVSPNGQDRFDGTSATVTQGHGPFQTLQRARDEIRKLKKSGHWPTEGVIVELADGTYNMSQPLVLNADDSGNKYQKAIMY